MIVRRLVLIGVGAAVVLGGTAIVLDQMAPARQAPTTAGANPNSPDGSLPRPTDTATNGTAGAGGGTETPAPATSEAPPSGVTDSPSASTDSPKRPVLEVLPPTTATPTGLPLPTPPAPLIRTPLPASGSAEGKVVDGFPGNVVTFPERTVLVSTSVSSSDRILQVTADGIVELSAAQVTGHFQQTLLALGFQSEAETAADGQQSIRLSRGTDTVTVSITTTGTGSTRFTLLGTLHA